MNGQKIRRAVLRKPELSPPARVLDGDWCVCVCAFVCVIEIERERKSEGARRG